MVSADRKNLSLQKLHQAVAASYPGQETSIIILGLYQDNPQEGTKGLTVKQIARRFGVRNETVRGFIPPTIIRSKSDNAQRSHLGGEPGRINKEGLQRYAEEMQATKQSRVTAAEQALLAGLPEDVVKDRYKLSDGTVRKLRVKVFGIRRTSILDKPTVRHYLKKPDNIEKLLASCDGSDVDYAIIMERILREDPAERTKFEALAERFAYTKQAIILRERRILERAGIVPRKERRSKRVEQGDEMTA